MAVPATPAASASAPTAVAATATPVLESAMPASDGGAMLWPAPLTLTPQEPGGVPYTRVGFVDVNGKLVVPQRYDSYRSCPNAGGRAAFVIASAAGHNDDILDLSGNLLRTAPTPDAICGGPDHIIIQRVIDAEIGKLNAGLLDLVTGKIDVPIGRNRHISVVDPVTVNVSDPWGEYLLDLRSGARTPHPGFLDEEAGVGDGSFLVVTDRRRDANRDRRPKIGVIDRAGTWVLKPGTSEIKGFAAGYAMVFDGDTVTFLDQSMQRTGGTWDEVDPVHSATADVVVGYRVTQGDKQGLLGMDLAPIVAPGTAAIECDDVTATCAVTENNATTMVVLPTGAKTPLPAGFTLVLGPGFFADRLPGESVASQRVYVAASGQVITLPAISSCSGVGNSWVACETEVGMAPPTVIDAAGRVTAFATAVPVADPVPDQAEPYYWVTAGDLEGFVDGNGNWRYKQSRFTQLED